MTRPPFAPHSDWQAPKLAELPSWASARRVSVDIETKDLELKKLGIGVRRGGHIVGVSFAIEDGPSAYLPIAHAGGGNLDRDHVLSYLRDQAACFRGNLVGANLQYDLDYLAEAGVEYRQVKFFRDVQVAEPLLDDLQISYSLDNIAARRGLPGKDEALLDAAAKEYGVDSKAGLWQLPAHLVGPYAEQDARLPLRLIQLQERLLESEELWPVYDLESRLLPVLLRMRRRGVRVSFDRLKQVSDWSEEREDQALSELSRLTGTQLGRSDTNRASVLVKLLEARGIRLPRTPPTEKFPEGQPSVASAFLKTLTDPVGKQIVEAKKFRKLRDTFVASVRRYAIGDRIHTTFNQLRKPRESDEDEDNGARYGRVSVVDPNLQQQPARDPEIGPRWRSIYIPDHDQWVCLDYSQQEPRWMTHLAATLKTTGAEAARQRYVSDPTTDNHQMMADLTGLTRMAAKEIYLGLCYGMGGAKLARKLDLPTKWVVNSWTGKNQEVAGDEAQAILDKFNAGAPFIRETAKLCQEAAESRGYVRTVGGRKCRFPLAPPGRKNRHDYTHKGLNRWVQGGSGDQTKTAMVEGDAAGYEIQLQVHDELDLSTTREAAEGLAEIMRECVPCTVPAKVDIECGPSWGECE